MKYKFNINFQIKMALKITGFSLFFCFCGLLHRGNSGKEMFSRENVFQEKFSTIDQAEKLS